MKNKELKKLIKFHIESHIPNQAPKIDFPFEKVVHEKRIKFNARHGLSLVMTIFVVVLLVSFLFNPNTEKPSQLNLEEKQVMSYALLSSTSILTNILVTEELNLNVEPMIVPPIIKHVKPYLNMVEQMIHQEKASIISSGESVDSTYQYYMNFETRDLLGNVISYVMFYDLILEDLDQDEAEYEIIGVLVSGSQSFEVFGEKKVEDDEMVIKFKAYKDSDNYISSTYKIESDEEVFKFEVFSFGNKVSEIKVKIEYDGDETKIELEFIEDQNEGKFEFEFFTEDDKNLLKIEFESRIDGILKRGEMIVEVIIDPITLDTFYKIYVDSDDEDPYEYESKRSRKDDETDTMTEEVTEDVETEEETED